VNPAMKRLEGAHLRALRWIRDADGPVTKQRFFRVHSAVGPVGVEHLWNVILYADWIHVDGKGKVTVTPEGRSKVTLNLKRRANV